MALTEVMGGQMHLARPAAPILSPVAGNAKRRILATTARGPTALAPGLQPVVGAVPGYELNGWYGMLGAPGTPRAIVQRLNQELTRIAGEPVMLERMLGVGAEPAPASPASFGECLGRETVHRGRLLKEAGIKPQ